MALLSVGVLLIAVTYRPAKAEPRQHVARSAVVLSATEGQVEGSLVVYQYSAGPGAPQIKLYSELGDVLTLLLSNGFTISHTGPGVSYTLTR